MRWPSPRAQTAQPERWRMRRWSKEPRRMSVVEGSAEASLARAWRVLSVCFIYIHETLKRGSVSRVFQTFLRDFVFLDWRSIAPRTELPSGGKDDACPFASHVSSHPSRSLLNNGGVAGPLGESLRRRSVTLNRP